MHVLTPQLPPPTGSGRGMAGSLPRASPPLARRLILLPPSLPQLVSEKVGGAEGTKLDDDFKEMEKVMGEVVRSVKCPVPLTVSLMRPSSGGADGVGLTRVA